MSRQQWAIACAIDGTPSIQDLAWRCGLALYDTIECVGHLIQAGVCVPGPRPAGPPVLLPTAVLPPDRSRPVVNADVPGGADFAPAQPELLRRVLDGLRRMG